MLQHLYRFILPAAYDVLPPQMASERSDAMLLAIALQESKCNARHQGGKGPARSFWQFETGGIAGVQTHRKTAVCLRGVLAALCYPPKMPAPEIRLAIEHNDVLACCLARLLLWTLPMPLPPREAVQLGWEQYIDGWRPGKPRPEDWPGNFKRAWQAVGADNNDLVRG